MKIDSESTSSVGSVGCTAGYATGTVTQVALTRYGLCLKTPANNEHPPITIVNGLWPVRVMNGCSSLLFIYWVTMRAALSQMKGAFVPRYRSAA